MFEWTWWGVLIDFFRDEGAQSALRVSFAVITTILAVLTFRIRLRDRSANAPPRLATAETSWDAQSKFPICPLPTRSKMAPFPFISQTQSERSRSENGWLTVTEIRIWNAGKGIIFGPYVKRTSVAELRIPDTIGPYQIRWCVSNDPEMACRVGGASRDSRKMEDRRSIGFDFMHAGKGILVSIWHNAETGDGIRIRAFSEQTPSPVVGSHHVFQPWFVKLMTMTTDILLAPAAIVTLYMAYGGNTWLAVLSALFTLNVLFAAYITRTLTFAPYDLNVHRILQNRATER